MSNHRDKADTSGAPMVESANQSFVDPHHERLYRDLRRIFELCVSVSQEFHLIQCRRSNCQADNPRSARFCRRCGSALTGGQP